MIVVDTSILIDHLRGRDEPTRVLADAVRNGETLAASVLTRVEILGPMRSSERSAITRLFTAIHWLPVTTEIADRAGELASGYRRSHGSIDLVDYVIAATVERTAGRLWTLNVRHFPMIKGLTAPY